MKNSTLTRIQSGRIVPVMVIEDAAVAVDLADALLEAGLGVIEITFRTAAAAQAIANLASRRPDMLVGAGTLLSADNVRQAMTAGAKFGVAPGLNTRIVEAARLVGLDFAPGVATPSEVELALELGCKLSCDRIGRCYGSGRGGCDGKALRRRRRDWGIDETVDGSGHGCARRRNRRQVSTRGQADFFFGVRTSVSSSRVAQPIQ